MTTQFTKHSADILAAPGQNYVRDESGNIVSRSRNLAGLVRAIGKRIVERVDIGLVPAECTNPHEYEAFLVVSFGGGDTFATGFGSLTVLRGWVAARRNLAGVPLYCDGVQVA